MYLCGGGPSASCDRIPIEIENCPVCGSGLRFSRGFTWLRWDKYAGTHVFQEGVVPPDRHPGLQCKCLGACPICWPFEQPQPYGLMWVGEKFYSPSEFIKEALQMGVSRRIAAIPKNLKLGETWILCAHKHVIPFKNEKNEDDFKPAVFYAFKAQTIEYIIWQKDATPDKLAELEKKHITAIIIPDGDKDHDPSSKVGLDDDEKEEVVERVYFNDLRSKLGRK